MNGFISMALLIFPVNAMIAAYLGGKSRNHAMVIEVVSNPGIEIDPPVAESANRAKLWPS